MEKKINKKNKIILVVVILAAIILCGVLLKYPVTGHTTMNTEEEPTSEDNNCLQSCLEEYCQDSNPDCITQYNAFCQHQCEKEN